MEQCFSATLSGEKDPNTGYVSLFMLAHTAFQLVQAAAGLTVVRGNGSKIRCKWKRVMSDYVEAHENKDFCG